MRRTIFCANNYSMVSVQMKKKWWRPPESNWGHRDFQSLLDSTGPKSTASHNSRTATQKVVYVIHSCRTLFPVVARICCEMCHQCATAIRGQWPPGRHAAAHVRRRSGPHTSVSYAGRPEGS